HTPPLPAPFFPNPELLQQCASNLICDTTTNRCVCPSNQYYNNVTNNCLQ
ncbi:unnamed protein product, partial [Candidula unifasciata]